MNRIENRKTTFRRLLYSLVIVVALVVAWIKMDAYLHNVRVGRGGSTAGLLDLGYLLAMVALVVIAMRVLLRTRSSRAIDRLDRGEIRNGSRNAAELTGRSIQYSDTSLRDKLRQLPTIAREAFGRRPIWASILSMFMISIPVLLVSMAHAGGLKAFGLHEWILVAVMELPLVIVACIVFLAWNPMLGQAANELLPFR